jgi:hypothetical protein
MDDLVAPPPLKKDTRMLGIGLCALAALLLLFSCFSHRWLENRQAKQAGFGFSLLSFEACMDDKCESKSNSELIEEARSHGAKDLSGAFAPMGKVTLVLMLLAVVGLIGTAVFAQLKKRLEWPILPTTVGLLALMVSLITGCVFVATKPGGVGGVGVGLGFWAFGIGTVVGIAGLQMLNKLIKPVDPDVPLDGAY